MRIVTGLLAAVLLVSYLSVDGVLEHEDSIELGDGAPTPVLAAHNERLKQGIAQLQNGKTLSPAKPARHDSALELREEDAAGSQMASSATKDTSLGESVQVRQKANLGLWRRRRRRGGGGILKGALKSVQNLAKNAAKGMEKAKKALHQRHAAKAKEAEQKRNAAKIKSFAKSVKKTVTKVVKAVKKNVKRVVKKTVKKQVKKDVKKVSGGGWRRRRRAPRRVVRGRRRRWRI